jgi:virginiamycin B lyase
VAVSVSATQETAAATVTPAPARQPELAEYPVARGSRPHDVSPAADGGVWYSGQGDGTLGHLDPATGGVRTIDLGQGSAPHGVITAADGSAWITDGGLNAVLRVDPSTGEIRRFPLPPGRGGANLNTCTFGGNGDLWFTGQGGIYGRVRTETGDVSVFDAPRGSGPYGMCTTPSGDVYYASLAGNHIARIDLETGAATVIEPPTARQGARRVWSDSAGRIWVSEWNAGQVGVFDPVSSEWREWRLPGDRPQCYSVWVDERDTAWLTDFGANAIVRFDPATEVFTSFPLPRPGASVRQMLGRPGEAWGAESATDALVVIRS